MTEPMQRPDHEASRWPRDFDIRQRYAEQQELLEPPPARGFVVGALHWFGHG
nr:hypothetical protein [Pseudomonas aeruginosa]